MYVVYSAQTTHAYTNTDEFILSQDRRYILEFSFFFRFFYFFCLFRICFGTLRECVSCAAGNDNSKSVEISSGVEPSQTPERD